MKHHVGIKLPWDRLALLRQFIADEIRTRATRKHQSSGFHNRVQEWATRLQDDGTVWLSTISRGRHDSDMEWIAKAIMGRDIGGAQRHTYDVFVNTHKAFTGLPIKPRSKRGEGPRARLREQSLFGEEGETP